jgi:hypothetical protein
LIGCYWIAMDTTVRFWHKADAHLGFVDNESYKGYCLSVFCLKAIKLEGR